MNPKIAVLIPCYNESVAIAQVVRDFREQIPAADIYVYDNGSSDNSVALAKQAGAKVRMVTKRGKGHVVRRMFADVEADIYIMVDGDGTYDARYAMQAVDVLQDGAHDMVVCVRKPLDEKSFRPGHQSGNKWFTRIVNFLFDHTFHDIFSGYRVFSRRFVKTFPAISQGFEIEAEMTIHALQLGIPIAEIETPYQERPSGSESKLKTIRDGFRILRTVLMLFLYVRPMMLFGNLFLITLVASLILGVPIILEFYHTGLVPRIPTAILSASLVLLAALSLAGGIILDSMSRARLETKKLWYLTQSRLY
jgi:glycosyltransferase involved in cell wall biosynthesis